MDRRGIILGKLRSRCFASLLIFIQCIPARAALAPLQPERTKLGILRVGELRSREEEKAYVLLEKRVQRWFENFSSPRPVVHTLDHSLASEELSSRAKESRLAILSRNILESHDPGMLLGQVDELRKLKRELEPYPSLGPLLQKAALAEAAFLLSDGKKSAALAATRAALAFHPDGKSPEWDGWEEEPTQSSLRFESLLSEVGSQVRGLCDVELSVQPSTAEVNVNGYAQGKRRTFQLPAGRFEMVFANAGFQPSKLSFRCDRTSKIKREVHLAPTSGKPALAVSELETVRQRNALGSLFVIQPVRDEFRFFLLSADGKLDPVPTQRPLKISEVSGGTEDGIPISQDEMRGLLQKHSLALSLSDLTGVASDSGAGFGLGVSEGSVGRSSGWYNDWRVWAVVGGLATGILGAYLLTRGPEVQTQPGISIRLE